MKILEKVFIYTFMMIGVVIYQLMKLVHQSVNAFMRIDSVDVHQSSVERMSQSHPRPVH